MIKAKAKLNPAAPVFTPLSTHRLALIERALVTPRRDVDVDVVVGGWEGNDSAPASPADSTGPVTPSPVRSMFAFAARVAHTKSSEGGSAAELSFPIGVGGMRVVRPKVVVGEQREGEVFVFF